MLDSQRVTNLADAHPHPLYSGRSRLPRLDRRGGFHFRSFHPRPRAHPRTDRPQQRPTPERGRNLFLHRPRRAHLHHSHGRARRHPHWTQPSRRRQRSHRHARQRPGVWTFLRVISIFVVVAWLLALGNSVYLAPRSLAALGQLQNRLKSSQVSFEVQPRVFYEGFPKIVLYVQDVKAMSGGALWKGVFLADLSDPSSPRISLAREGLLVSQGPDTLDLHLTTGSTHETDPKNPDQYQISTFQTTDIPIRVPATQNGQEHEPTSLGEMKVADLLYSARTGDPATRR